SPQPPASACWPRGLPEPTHTTMADRTPRAVSRLSGRTTGTTVTAPPSSFRMARPPGRAIPTSHSTAAPGAKADPQEATTLQPSMVVPGARAATGAKAGPPGTVPLKPSMVVPGAKAPGTVPLKPSMVVPGARAAGAKAGTLAATPLNPRTAGTPGIALAMVV